MLFQSSLCLERWCGTESLVITTIWLNGALVVSSDAGRSLPANT